MFSKTLGNLNKVVDPLLIKPTCYKFTRCTHINKTQWIIIPKYVTNYSVRTQALKLLSLANTVNRITKTW